MLQTTGVLRGNILICQLCFVFATAINRLLLSILFLKSDGLRVEDYIDILFDGKYQAIKSIIYNLPIMQMSIYPTRYVEDNAIYTKFTMPNNKGNAIRLQARIYLLYDG